MTVSLRIAFRHFTGLSRLLAGLIVLQTFPVLAQDTPEDEAFIWNTSSYVKKFREAMARPEQIARGIGGGAPVQIKFPGSWETTVITKLHVYHTDDRVYGLQFGYTFADKGYQETAVIGGTSGTRSTLELSREKPLHFIRGHYDLDPARHYYTPVLTGLSVGVYSKDMVRTEVEPGLSHDDLIEVHAFGKPGPGTSSPPEGMGFDVHLMQGIRAVNACVSPTDRNGRIFSLGVVTYGLMGDREQVSDWCRDQDPNWRKQPLGPAKIPLDNPFNDPEIAAQNFDPYEAFSGIYTRLDQGYERDLSGDPAIDGKNNTLAAKWRSPQALIAVFGDRATVKFENVPNPVFTLDMVLDEKKQRTDRNYAFQYANGSMFIGVEVEEINGKKFSYITFDHDQKSGRQYIGRYREARLGDDLVAKRNWERTEARNKDQSRKGLFELQSVVKGYEYMYSGYNPPEMDLFDLNKGQSGLKNIFSEPGEYQWHTSSKLGKAVLDGLQAFELANSHTDDSKTILTSSKQYSEMVSKSLGATVPIKGVPVGLSYSTSNSTAMNSTKKQMKAFATSRMLTHAFVLDKPNAFLANDFIKAVRDIYRAPPARQASLAQDMVKVFGTHYAAAITFGGLGIAEETVSASTYGSQAKKAYTLGATIGDKEKIGAEAKAEMSESTSRVASTFSEFGSSSFKGRGQAGSWGKNGWSITPESAVPILYDLRPISELFEPVILSKALNNDYDAKKVVSARTAVHKAIEDHFSQYPPPKTYSSKPHIYRLSAGNFACTHAGDDSSTVHMFGDLKLLYHHGPGNGETTLLNASDTKFSCNGTAKSDVEAEVILWFEPDATTAAGQPLYPASIRMKMYEDDDSVIDLDDQIDQVEILAAIPIGFDAVSGTLSFGGGDGGDDPKFTIDYTWQRLE